MSKDVVSLPIAKKLKEAGWKQEQTDQVFDEHGGLHSVTMTRFPNDSDAVTIGELLEALPKFCGVVKHDENEFQAYKLATNLDYIAPNPADALALLWVALKEKGLV